MSCAAGLGPVQQALHCRTTGLHAPPVPVLHFVFVVQHTFEPHHRFQVCDTAREFTNAAGDAQAAGGALPDLLQMLCIVSFVCLQAEQQQEQRGRPRQQAAESRKDQ